MNTYEKAAIFRDYHRIPPDMDLVAINTITKHSYQTLRYESSDGKRKRTVRRLLLVEYPDFSSKRIRRDYRPCNGKHPDGFRRCQHCSAGPTGI